MLSSNCGACGVAFSFAPSRARKFCSRDCWRGAKSAAAEKAWAAPDRECLACGSVKPSDQFTKRRRICHRCQSAGKVAAYWEQAGRARPPLRTPEERVADARSRNRREKERRKRGGLCTACGSRPARVDATNCAPCSERSSANGSRWRTERAQQGVCIRCGDRPPMDGCGQCEPCSLAALDRIATKKRGMARSRAVELLAAQDGRCEISGRPIAFPGPGSQGMGAWKGRSKAVIDHYDAPSGPVARGVIESGVNSALGQFGHDPVVCVNAAVYIARYHPEKKSALVERLHSALAQLTADAV